MNLAQPKWGVRSARSAPLRFTHLASCKHLEFLRLTRTMLGHLQPGSPLSSSHLLEWRERCRRRVEGRAWVVATCQRRPLDIRARTNVAIRLRAVPCRECQEPLVALARCKEANPGRPGACKQQNNEVRWVGAPAAEGGVARGSGRRWRRHLLSQLLFALTLITPLPTCRRQGVMQQ